MQTTVEKCTTVHETSEFVVSEILEGTELSRVEGEVFPVPVPAACHLAEEDLMVSDLVLVNYGAVGLGECSLDDRNSVVGDIEFTPVEPFTAADREAAGARFLFAPRISCTVRPFDF